MDSDIRVDEVDCCVHVAQVTVHSLHARQGMGRRLIERAAYWGAARQLRALTLATFEQVPWNASYYRRLGFETVPEELWRGGHLSVQKVSPLTKDLVATIATEATMTTIPHRELRNQSSKILERVKNGETIDVTNNGEVAATLTPPATSPLERLLLSGSVRRASANPVDFQLLARVQSDASTAEILSDLRGDR